MKLAIGFGIAVLVIIGVALSLPFLIDLTQYQDQYKPPIEEALNRKIQLRDIRLTIWPRLGARVTGFVVLDDPAFGTEPFASLTSLEVGVQLIPLLKGKIEVEEITLRDPVITVIKNHNGVLNVSTLGRPGVVAPEVPSRAPLPSTEGPLRILGLLAVDRVALLGGKLTYRDLSAAQRTDYVLQDLDLLLQSVRLGQTPTLHLRSLVQPYNLPVTLDGTFGPLKETTDIDAMNFQLTLGNTSLAITGHTKGRDATVTITSPVINTANLPFALPLQQPINITDLKISAQVQGQEALLHDLSFRLFDGQVTAQGMVLSGPKTPPFNVKLTGRQLQLAPALAALATAPVSLSGTAGADLVLRGHGFTRSDLTRALEGTGHVAAKDGKIEGVNLLREAISLLKVAGMPLGDGTATAFSTIESDLAIAEGAIRVERLLIDSHDFQATGGGVIGFDQSLNLLVNLNFSQALSQKLASASPVAKLALKEERLRLPLIITGTTQAPSYGIDMKGLTGKVQEQVQKKAKETVEGLLKGTTKPEDLKQQGKDLLKGLFGR